MMLEDIFSRISSETGSVWTKLGRWMAVRKSEAVKFSVESRKGPKPSFFNVSSVEIPKNNWEGQQCTAKVLIVEEQWAIWGLKT